MNRIRPWIAIAMIAVAVLGAGALLVTLYATEQRVRVDQQLPDRVGDVSETTAAVNRVNEELYRTNAELVLLIETVEATNAELLRVIETIERTNGRLEQAVDTATARLVDLQRKRGLTR